MFFPPPLLLFCFPLQDFETNNELKTKVIAFLEEVMHDPELLTQERKAAANIIRYLSVLFQSAIEICVQISRLDIFLISFILLPFARTLTQEDHGDNQITLEDVTQLVSVIVYYSVNGRFIKRISLFPAKKS